MQQHRVSYHSRRVRLRLLIRRILRRDTSSPRLLFLAFGVGLLTGLVCCGFEMALDELVQMRLTGLLALPPLWRWGAAFVSGALMAGFAI